VYPKRNLNGNLEHVLKRLPMSAIQAWCGCCLPTNLQASNHRVVVNAFAKMGGKFLGNMVLPNQVGVHDYFDAIRELQRQGSVLLPHHERPCEYLSIVVDNEVLPNMTYGSKYGMFVSPMLGASLRVLQRATSASKLELVWDDDDREALGLIRAGLYESHLNIEIDGTYNPELLKVLAFHFNPQTVRINQDEDYTTQSVDLSFLAKFRALCDVTLVRVRVKSWGWFSTTRVQSLNLHRVFMPASAFSGVCVKHLSIISNCHVDAPLSALQSLGLNSFAISVTNVDNIDCYKDLTNLACDDVCITIRGSNWAQYWDSQTKEWRILTKQAKSSTKTAPKPSTKTAPKPSTKSAPKPSTKSAPKPSTKSSNTATLSKAPRPH
jgi:hypothetical protein